MRFGLDESGDGDEDDDSDVQDGEDVVEPETHINRNQFLYCIVPIVYFSTKHIFGGTLFCYKTTKNYKSSKIF